MSIRLAVLGAGRIGQVHARAIAENDTAMLAAIANLIAAAANAIVSMTHAVGVSVEVEIGIVGYSDDARQDVIAIE
ncbi:hypothetical protein [Candidatus Puniceispirillum sp.]|uniref:hypothetical protein n=1 Tax=Candidatus Puniceispirillum sp. TaxID=2026719 RepID=UPI003F696CB6